MTESIYLNCSVNRFNKEGGRDYSEDKLINWVIYPIKNKTKCYVCEQTFQNNDKGVIVILPKDQFSFKHVVCHNDCYLLMTMEHKNIN